MEEAAASAGPPEAQPEAELAVGGGEEALLHAQTATAELKRKREDAEPVEESREPTNGEIKASETEVELPLAENGAPGEEHEEKVVEAGPDEDGMAKRPRLDEQADAPVVGGGEAEVVGEVGNGHAIAAEEAEKQGETAAGEADEPKAAEVVVSESEIAQPSDLPQQATDGQPVTRRIEVPNNKVGVLIGKAGETIKFLQFNTGAKIQIMRDAEVDLNAPSRPVELVGTLESIDKAEKLIKEVMAEADAGGSPALVARGFGASQLGAEQLQIQIPNEKVGLIIGKGGETIKNLQTRSRARIQLIPQHLPEGDISKERTVRITGTKEQIDAAIEMIKQVMNQVPLRGAPTPVGYTQPLTQYRGSTPAQWGARSAPPSQHVAGYNYPPRGGPYAAHTTYSASAYRPPPTRGSYGPSAWEPRASAVPDPSQKVSYDYYRQGVTSAPVAAASGYYGQLPAYSQQPAPGYGQAPASQPGYGQASQPAAYPYATQPQQAYAKPTYGLAPAPYGTLRTAGQPAEPAYQGAPAATYGHTAPAQPQQQPQPQAYPYGPAYGQQPQQQYSTQYPQPAPVYAQYPATVTGYGEQAATVVGSGGYGYATGGAGPVVTASESAYTGNLMAPGSGYGLQPGGAGYEQKPVVTVAAPPSGAVPPS
ncbi:KH domain-containing protein [Wolffia australiana]